MSGSYRTALRALVALLGAVVTVFGLALARHLRWSRRFRKRIGSYTS